MSCIAVILTVSTIAVISLVFSTADCVRAFQSLPLHTMRRPPSSPHRLLLSSSSTKSYVNPQRLLLASPGSENDEDRGGDGIDDVVLVEVCMSPGCLADGAKDTLLRLQALVPSSIPSSSISTTSSTCTSLKVCEGGCRSLCGNGPVVVINGKKTMRRIKGNDKLLSVLLVDSSTVMTEKEPRSSLSDDQQTILKAFDIFDEARGQHYDMKRYDDANELYTKAIRLGMSVLHGDDEKENTTVAWLIEAMQSQADCLSELKMYRDAADVMKSAVQICNSFSRSSDDGDSGDYNDYSIKYLYGCLERCQVALEQVQTPQARASEVEVLETLLSLTLPAKLSTTQQNRRRSLGFRLQRLQKENL